MDSKKLVAFLSFWVANSVLLLVASAIFGNNVVLGNDKLSIPMAAVFSGFILTALTSLVQPVVKKSGYKIKNENAWPVIFLVANFVIIWVIKRLAIVTGFGISSFWYVLILAVVATAVQWGVAKATGAMSKK